MSSVQNIQFDEEDIVVEKSSNAADARFDLIIGSIEDIIMEDKFQELQEQFMIKNYKHFDSTDENKLIYTTIHKEYVNLIEKYLETQLKKRIENFSMDEFMKDLVSRKDEIDGEIFEILLTFDDFIEFKEMMLSYKLSKEGKGLDLGLGLCIQSLESARSTGATNTNRGKPQQQAKTNTPLLDKTQVDSDHE